MDYKDRTLRLMTVHLRLERVRAVNLKNHKNLKNHIQKMPEQININQMNNFNDLPIDIKIAILKKVVGSDRKELEKIQQVHPHWLFITKTNDFMTPIFGKSN